MASNDMEGTGAYKSGQSASKQDGTAYKPKLLTQVSQLTLVSLAII